MFRFPGAAVAKHLSAAASQASTVTGAAVDLNALDGPMVVVQSHGTGTGTLDGKIQDSDDGSTGWADVSGATFPQRTTTAAIDSIVLPRTKRYVRYVGTIGTGPQVVGVVLVGLQKSV